MHTTISLQVVHSTPPPPPPTLTKNPGADAKQEVCHYSIKNDHLAGRFIAMVHLLPTVPYQEIGITGDISGERLTSSSRAGVTSTACMETLLVGELTFQRRA
jgi:hypothetical protein